MKRARVRVVFFPDRKELPAADMTFKYDVDNMMHDKKIWPTTLQMQVCQNMAKQSAMKDLTYDKKRELWMTQPKRTGKKKQRVWKAMVEAKSFRGQTVIETYAGIGGVKAGTEMANAHTALAIEIEPQIVEEFKKFKDVRLVELLRADPRRRHKTEVVRQPQIAAVPEQNARRCHPRPSNCLALYQAVTLLPSSHSSPDPSRASRSIGVIITTSRSSSSSPAGGFSRGVSSRARKQWITSSE